MCPPFSVTFPLMVFIAVPNTSRIAFVVKWAVKFLIKFPIMFH
jgi:hypothetical protein